jgi:phosphoglycerate kinase
MENKEEIMKKTIKQYDLKGKKVIIRVDFNVPMKDGNISDDTRIRESIPTIKYAVEQGAKVILMSHLGRIKTEEDKPKNSLQPVASRLSELMDIKVKFACGTRGLEEIVDSLNNGDILLIENTRYEDLDGEKESKNDPKLGKYWASLGDIYINDAFGTSHRAHASNVGIASLLPNGIGFLIEKELKAFEPVLTNPEHPYMIIMGGAKVSDKIGVIKTLAQKCDYLLIGGGMAYTFLKAKGYEIGKSLLDAESIDFCKEMLETYPQKIILPVDNICCTEVKGGLPTRECLINEIRPDEIGLDIGPKTIGLFQRYLMSAKTVVWNGPVGYSQIKEFENGTKALCEQLSKLDAYTVVGGGDTADAVVNLGYKDAVDHISTGGGASLELLEGKKLPGIEIIEEN